MAGVPMKRQQLPTVVMQLAVAAIPILAATAGADDWPQILGPQRNGSSSEKLPNRFPAAGPKPLWSVAVGQGYAGPAVADGKVIVFHRAEGKERVAAFEAKSGKPLWAADFPAIYRGGFNDDLGPRCVP